LFWQLCLSSGISNEKEKIVSQPKKISPYLKTENDDKQTLNYKKLKVIYFFIYLSYQNKHWQIEISPCHNSLITIYLPASVMF